MENGPATTPDAPARERDDLGTLLLAFLLVPALWIALGWRPGLLLSNYDGPQLDLPFVRELTAAGGDWRALLYRPGWLGGARVWDVAGAPWPQLLAAMLGLRPDWTLNLHSLLLQALQGFLLLRLARDLPRLWGRAPARLPAGLQLVLLTLLCFTPELGWRLSRAHWAIAGGTLGFVATLAVAAAGAAGTLTWTLVGASLAVVTAALGTVVQQPLVYGALFGAPILAGMLWARGRARAGLPPAALLVLGSLGLAAPVLVRLVSSALGDEGARVVGGGRALVYGWITGTARDLWASLPWLQGVVDPARPPVQLHETNVPLGAPLLLLALVPWRKARALGAGLALSALAAALFALDVRPFSDALLAVPLVSSFRVPTRALLPFATVLPAVAVAGLLWREPGPLRARVAWLAAGVSVLVAPVLMLLPPLAAELLLVAAAIAAIASLLRPPPARVPVVALLLAILAAGSVAAFRQRLVPLADAERALRDASGLREQALRAAPELASPLVRAVVVRELPDVYSNSAMLAGLGSVNGYWFPPRRTLALVLASAGMAYDPTAVHLTKDTVAAAFPVLQRLYDVRWTLGRGETGAVVVSPTGDTPGPAWFSTRIEPLRGIPAIAAAVRERSPDLRAVASALLVDETDPAAARLAPLPAGPDYPACDGAAVLDARSPDGQAIVVRVQNPAPACPLTVSTGWSALLRATWHGDDGSVQPLETFPGYGALTSTLVPAGRGEVRLEAEARLPVAARLAQGLGLLALGAAALAVARGRRRSA